jgi:hypothetical protein
MATWEDPEYTLSFSTLGGGTIPPPPNNKFKLARHDASGATFYTVEPVTPGGPNPFTGCVLLLQNGRQLIHYLPPSQRLEIPDPINNQYKAKLELLIDEIVGTHIAADPHGFERLTGYIPFDGRPINPFILYKVENTHTNGELLVIARLYLVGQSPNGSIGVIGR